MSGISLEPVPVEGLGDDPELHDQVAREILWLDLAALLLPEAVEGSFVIAQNDPGIGAADEQAAIRRACGHGRRFPCAVANGGSSPGLSPSQRRPDWPLCPRSGKANNLRSALRPAHRQASHGRIR